MSRKAWITVSLVLLVVVGVVYGVILMRDVRETPRFVTAVAEPADVVATVGGSGALEAVTRRTVAAMSSGEVAEIAVSRGGSVRQGGRIATISSRELEYQIRGAELDVDSAVLNLREILGLTPEEPIPQEVASVVER
ncbi:MAG: biotin/lipoyl-binding protein, partial [Clostridia bacterium]